MIVECVEMMRQRQIVVVGRQVCHHQSTSVSRASRCCVAGVVTVTSGNVWVLNTQVIYATCNRYPVAFRSMAEFHRLEALLSSVHTHTHACKHTHAHRFV